MKTMVLLMALGISLISNAQEPVYTKKHFVTQEDTVEFKPSGPIKNGRLKTYLETSVTIYDVDDNNTTHVRGTRPVLLNIEGDVTNSKRIGMFRQYVIDSADHKKRFLIAEQTYVNDKLNGEWKVYNLKGTLVELNNFRNDTMHGLCRQYWIDGKTIMRESEFIDGMNKYIDREYKNGIIAMEVMYVNGEPNGEAKEYYETGVLKGKFNLKHGKRDGLRIYYYPDGKPWIQMIYKMDKPWTVVANYDSKGKKRNAGTLKEGNGTLIFYDDDTTIRETTTYRNGEEQQ